MQISTAQTLTALRALAALEFRPFGRADWALYSGAEEGAQIAQGDAQLLVDLMGSPCETGDATLDVVVSGARIEMHACTEAGNPISMTLDIIDL